MADDGKIAAGDDTGNGRKGMSVALGSWDVFLGWARRFYAWPAFDDQLRHYKLTVVAPALRDVRDAVRRGEVQWTWLLKLACQASSHDLSQKDLPTASYLSPFVRWCDANPSQARTVLLAVWDEQRDPVARVHEFMMAMDSVRKQIGRDVVKNGMYGMQASFLFLGENPYQLPMYRDDAFSLAYALAGYPKRSRTHPRDSGGVYRHALAFLDQLMHEARVQGLEVRDRLDAQSLSWCVTTWPTEWEPVASWPTEDHKALVTYRDAAQRGRAGGRHYSDMPGEVKVIRAAIAEYAGKTVAPSAEWHGQGYVQSSKARRALERYAMQRAIEWYEGQGWQVRDVSATNSYDLHCTRESGAELRVEVKGTTSLGDTVLLTPNEVRLARLYAPHTALIVVAHLQLDGTETTDYAVSGGELLCFQPWSPDDEALASVGYVYTLPPRR